MLCPWRTRTSLPGTLGSTVQRVIEKQRRKAFDGAGRMCKEQRGLGELKFQNARRGVRVADQIHAGIEGRVKRDRAHRARARAQLIRARYAWGDLFGCEQIHRWPFAATQQRSFANGMTESAAEVDERRLAVRVDAIQIRLQDDAAFCGEQPLNVLRRRGELAPAITRRIARS